MAAAFFGGAALFITLIIMRIPKLIITLILMLITIRILMLNLGAFMRFARLQFPGSSSDEGCRV